MQQDLLSADELLGNINSFTVEQRTARETFIEQELHLPREWLCEDGCGVDASPAGRVATSIYNTVVESGAADPRFSNWGSWQMTGSFAGIIRDGGDALLWALIRIGLEECVSEDLAELCESRGFIVRLPRNGFLKCSRTAEPSLDACAADRLERGERSAISAKVTGPT